MATTPHPQAPGVWAWTPEHLLRMLQDDTYQPPDLLLKGLTYSEAEQQEAARKGNTLAPFQPNSHRIGVRRFYDPQYGPCISKTYRGLFSKRVGYEEAFLKTLSQLVPLGETVLKYTGFDAGHTTTIKMTWGGFSVDNWNTLLGARSPLTQRVAVRLALVAKLLEKLKPFHEMGFVHGDLLPGNMVLGHVRVPRAGPTVMRLDLSTLRLIDFEFSWAPLGRIPDSPVRIERDWFRQDDGRLIWLNPHNHSKSLLPGDPGQFVTRPDGSTARHEYPNATERLQRINWSADLYSLGCWVMGPDLRDTFSDDALASDAAWDYLQKLPAKLKAFDAALAHAVEPPVGYDHIIDEIKALLHSVPLGHQLEFTVPGLQDAQVRAAETVIEASVEPEVAPPAPKPPPAPPVPPVPPARPAPSKPWGTVAVLASLAAGAGWWALQSSPLPNPPSKQVPPADSTPVGPSVQPTSQPAKPVLGTGTADVQQQEAIAASEKAKDAKDAEMAKAKMEADKIIKKAEEEKLAAQKQATEKELAAKRQAEQEVLAAQAARHKAQTAEWQQAQQALASQAMGSAPWLKAWPVALQASQAPAISQAQRQQFWQTQQTRYLNISASMEKGPWWQSPLPAANALAASKGSSKATAPSAADLAWLNTTTTLAQQGLWVAQQYLSRARVSERTKVWALTLGPGNYQPPMANALRSELAQLVATPQWGPAPAPDTAYTLRAQGADLLFRLVLLESRGAKQAAAKGSSRPTQDAKPVLDAWQALASLQYTSDDQRLYAHRALGYSYACLLPKADWPQAQTHFQKAAALTPQTELGKKQGQAAKEQAQLSAKADARLCE